MLRKPDDVILEHEDGYDPDAWFTITLADALLLDDFRADTYGFTHGLEDLEILNANNTLNLSNRDLHDVEFTDQHIPDTDFRGANLRGACFKGATLEGADFRGADLTGADFTGAALADAKFDPQHKKEAA